MFRMLNAGAGAGAGAGAAAAEISAAFCAEAEVEASEDPRGAAAGVRAPTSEAIEAAFAATGLPNRSTWTTDA